VEIERQMARGEDWVRRNGAQFRLAIRITTAGIAAYAVGHVLGLKQSQWAVLTAIIVMQASVGASLKAVVDRLVGTLSGAAWGALVLLGLHHAGSAPFGAVLVIGLAPLAVLTALKPAYRVAPITAVILLLSPNLQAVSPIEAATQRMLEIGLGSLVALAVSLLVFPARAQGLLVQAVSQALRGMSELAAILAEGLKGQADTGAVQAAHDRIRASIGKAEAAAEEVLRERSSYLTSAVDPEPVCRTLRRLRHDLAIVGRAMTRPLPDAVAGTITDPTLDVVAAISAFLAASAEAVAKGRIPPSLVDLDVLFTAQSTATALARRQGVAQTLHDEDLDRVFGLGFALEQLHTDLRDLVDRGVDLSEAASTARGKAVAGGAD